MTNLPAPRPAKSVAARFRLTLLLVFGVGTFLALAAGWMFAGLAADEAYDRLLQSAAVQFLDGVTVAGGQFAVLPPESAFETLALAAEDRFFYAVRSPSGRLLTGYADLPERPSRGGAATAKDSSYHDADIRLLTVRRSVGVDGRDGEVAVTVAETNRARGAMRLKLFARQAPVTLTVAVIGFAASLMAATLAVRPLAALEKAIAERDSQDLRPIEIEGPRETTGLVAAINGLVRRLALRLDKLEAFSRLIAHQLRTPLAALGAQLDLLANETDPGSSEARVRRLQMRLSELNRLVHQLLGHAMMTYRGESAPRRTIDLVGIARAVALEAVADGIKNGEVAFEAPEDSLSVPADALMIHEAATNLVNNALRHGGPFVRIGASRRGAMMALTVADSGAGMTPEEWASAAEPFALKRPETAGAGLGLAIAREAAEMHGGALTHGRDDRGLFEVALLLPVAP